jgi:hypothetical protein
LRSTLGNTAAGPVGAVLGTLLQAASNITNNSNVQRPSHTRAATLEPGRYWFISGLMFTDNIFFLKSY